MTPPAGIGISAITAGDGALCSTRRADLHPAADRPRSDHHRDGGGHRGARCAQRQPRAHQRRPAARRPVDRGRRSAGRHREEPGPAGPRLHRPNCRSPWPRTRGSPTSAGTVLELRTDQAWFSGYPASCQLPTDQAAHPTELTCTGVAVDGLQLTLSGDQPGRVVAAGRRRRRRPVAAGDRRERGTAGRSSNRQRRRPSTRTGPDRPRRVRRRRHPARAQSDHPANRQPRSHRRPPAGLDPGTRRRPATEPSTAPTRRPNAPGTRIDPAAGPPSPAGSRGLSASAATARTTTPGDPGRLR